MHIWLVFTFGFFSGIVAVFLALLAASLWFSHGGSTPDEPEGERADVAASGQYDLVPRHGTRRQ